MRRNSAPAPAPAARLQDFTELQEAGNGWEVAMDSGFQGDVVGFKGIFLSDSCMDFIQVLVGRCHP